MGGIGSGRSPNPRGRALAVEEVGIIFATWPFRMLDVCGALKADRAGGTYTFDWDVWRRGSSGSTDWGTSGKATRPFGVPSAWHPWSAEWEIVDGSLYLTIHAGGTTLEEVVPLRIVRRHFGADTLLACPCCGRTCKQLFAPRQRRGIHGDLLAAALGKRDDPPITGRLACRQCWRLTYLSRRRRKVLANPLIASLRRGWGGPPPIRLHWLYARVQVFWQEKKAVSPNG